jgi:hypothetical protein
VVPRRKQLGKEPDEAMPSSRGDARTAERARTGADRRGEDSPPPSSEDLRTRPVRLTADFRG